MFGEGEFFPNKSANHERVVPISSVPTNPIQVASISSLTHIITRLIILELGVIFDLYTSPTFQTIWLVVSGLTSCPPTVNLSCSLPGFLIVTKTIGEFPIGYTTPICMVASFSAMGTPTLAIKNPTQLESIACSYIRIVHP